ncbi:Flagellar_Member_3 (plasmid) [Leishmania braziliensis MHOM/BR/75/M2904]|uniref:Flagellar_Member_3 n=1 Tax=Leishmania braziliensis MHOM/BR/75/M2904 TaxID=420245 RepID=A0A3P3Z2L3_LEIBR|nr:Flagellar_Member_3 [Leishmania braziliensis MHOM/BR/75/M2904]
MNECGDAVAAALRHAALMRDLASRYPFLRLHEEEGWPEALVADEAFARLAAEHADLACDPKRNAAALRGVEDAMNECGDAVAAALRHAALMRDLASRYPFLRLHEEEGWPEALVADEAFARLAAEHADLALDSKRNAAALRGVEDAMNECGDAVAAALRHAALMRDLASRYPFLRLHEEEGWPEALVADEAFARLAAEHADLACDPKRNAAALRGVEDAMNECGDAVAAALRHAALMRDLASRYPFLRLHEEEGWPEALVADEAFARLAAEHADLALDPKRNAAALRGVEDAMNECGDAVAAALRHAALMRDLASRYPFLRLHEEEGWPEALVADEAFARLAAEHADLALDPKRNAAALRGVEDAMNECGDAVAAALRHAALMRDLASRYPFLRLHEEEGWPEALVADEAFARLAAEHADLALDPKRNAAALRGVEDAMNECGDAVAAALRHAALMRDLASRYPFLRLHEEEGWPEALVADEAFARLAAEHADLACDPKRNAAALRGVEDAMNECGDAVAAALRHAALMRDLASRYPFLRLHEEEGWPEALVADEAFARLAAEHADLALDSKRNAAALRGVEDAMNECGDAVAAALRHAALMRDLASRYPFLRLHEEEGWPEALVADEAFARLAAEHADLALDRRGTPPRCAVWRTR